MTEKETSTKSKPTIFSMVAIGLTIAFFGIPVLIFVVIFVVLALFGSA